jgi:hypothetical protein
MVGLLKYGERRDYAIAARNMQLDSGRSADKADLARELVALRTRFKGNLDLLNHEPNGWVKSGLHDQVFLRWP